jgi:hypothetical protein
MARMDSPAGEMELVFSRVDGGKKADGRYVEIWSLGLENILLAGRTSSSDETHAKCIGHFAHVALSLRSYR